MHGGHGGQGRHGGQGGHGGHGGQGGLGGLGGGLGGFGGRSGFIGGQGGLGSHLHGSLSQLHFFIIYHPLNLNYSGLLTINMFDVDSLSVFLTIHFLFYLDENLLQILA